MILIIVQGMDLARFIQVFIVQGFAGLFYLFVWLKILKREARGLNLILSNFYLFVAAGVILNMIYINIFDEYIVHILHFITYYLLCLSLIFLLIFVLVLLKSENVVTVQKQLLLIFIFSILILGLWFIPNGITIGPSTSWKPEWSWFFFLYSIIVCSVFAIGPTIYYSLKIDKSFKFRNLKRKWRYFLIGIAGYFFLYYGTSLSNTLADPTFRLIWSFLSLPCLASLYFIYYGVAKQL